MKVNSLFVNITSTDPDRMVAFYRDVVGLPMRPDMGEHSLDAGGAVIGIDRHSDTHGPAREPSRMMLDLFVDDIRAEQARLEAHGVTFIRDKGREYWGGIISTFLDPDGNYVQLIEYKPELAEASA